MKAKGPLGLTTRTTDNVASALNMLSIMMMLAGRTDVAHVLHLTAEILEIANDPDMVAAIEELGRTFVSRLRIIAVSTRDNIRVVGGFFARNAKVAAALAVRAVHRARCRLRR